MTGQYDIPSIYVRSYREYELRCSNSRSWRVTSPSKKEEDPKEEAKEEHDDYDDDDDDDDDDYYYYYSTYKTEKLFLTDLF